MCTSTFFSHNQLTHPPISLPKSMPQIHTAILILYMHASNLANSSVLQCYMDIQVDFHNGWAVKSFITIISLQNPPLMKTSHPPSPWGDQSSGNASALTRMPRVIQGRKMDKVTGRATVPHRTRTMAQAALAAAAAAAHTVVQHSV